MTNATITGPSPDNITLSIAPELNSGVLHEPFGLLLFGDEVEATGHLLRPIDCSDDFAYMRIAISSEILGEVKNAS